MPPPRTTDEARETEAPAEEEAGLQGRLDATPKQVTEAVARHWAGPGPKPKNKRWL